MSLLQRLSVSLDAGQLMAAAAIPPALSQLDRALDPKTDLSGFQQRSSSIAGSGRRGR